MNYYYSKHCDVLDISRILLAIDLFTPHDIIFHRVYAIRWLAWYRIFYKDKNEEYRKLQISYFLDEIAQIVR